MLSKTLIKYRRKAHYHFDRIWKEEHKTRVRAYFWLAYKMNVPTPQCHISKFSTAQCKAVIAHSKDWFERHKDEVTA